MTAISTLTATTHLLSSTFSGLSKAAGTLMPNLYPYFITCTGLYHFGNGTSRISQTVELKTQDITQKTCKAAATVFAPSDYFLKMNGIFSTATGLCSVLEAFNHFGIINLGTVANLICTTGSLCFIYANVVALEENIRIFQEVKRSEGNDQPDSQANLRKQSAIFGILSNIGYILATALVLFSAPTALALVIGVVSSFSGGLKILSDLFLD